MEFDYSGSSFIKGLEKNKNNYFALKKIVESLSFDDETYIYNRGKKFAYYWLYSIEDLPHTIENFYNILDDNFEITTVAIGTISDRENAINWIDSISRTIRYNYHDIESFTATATPESTKDHFIIELNMVISWASIGITGTRMSAKNRYEIIIESNLGDEYSSLRKLKFAPVESFEVLK
ncbi:MAG: hypothetical protein JJE21_01015 [Spirochaetaceae bacterium]|nr:hypothetical protein [Spirochaetaceae bacterium]